MASKDNSDNNSMAEEVFRLYGVANDLSVKVNELEYQLYELLKDSEKIGRTFSRTIHFVSQN